MQTTAVFGILGIASLGALGGCAGHTRAGVALMQPESTGELPSIEVGSPRILDDGVNPMDGVRIAAQRDAIAVEFSHPRGAAAVDRLNPATLELLSRAPAATGTVPPGVESVRVAVDGDRHVIAVWKSGDGEHGYRVIAQAFNASDNAPRGAPVAVSPVGADVPGPLNAADVDGHRVLVAFAVSAGDHFEAYAVPLTVP